MKNYRTWSQAMRLLGEAFCGRCRVRVGSDDAEACWVCDGPLCYACWDRYGHCGHPSADEANRQARDWARRHECTVSLEEAAKKLGISVSHMRTLALKRLGLRGRGQRVSETDIKALRSRPGPGNPNLKKR